MPLHELMQPAHIAHEFIAGAQIEVVSVAQHKGSVDAFEVLGCQRFNSCLRTDRGEDRCGKVAMRCGKYPRAGAVIFGSDFEFKHRFVIVNENAEIDESPRSKNTRDKTRGLLYFFHTPKLPHFIAAFKQVV